MAVSYADRRTIKNLTPKYPYVFAWHRLLKSHDYYIAEQLTNAKLDGAPSNAIYLKSNGEWATISGLEPDAVQTLQEQVPVEYINNLTE